MIKQMLKIILRTYKTNLKPLIQWELVTLGILGVSYLPSEILISVVRTIGYVGTALPFFILTYIAIKSIRRKKKGWVNK